MEIEIQAQGFAVTAALRAYLAKRLEAALGPFKRQVRRVVARLGDENGPRGGYDKTCRIGVSVGGAPDVFAADTRPDLYAAIDCAVDRLAVALSRRLNRRRNLLRGSRALCRITGHPRMSKRVAVSDRLARIPIVRWPAAGDGVNSQIPRDHRISVAAISVGYKTLVRANASCLGLCLEEALEITERRLLDFTGCHIYGCHLENNYRNAGRFISQSQSHRRTPWAKHEGLHHSTFATRNWRINERASGHSQKGGGQVQSRPCSTGRRSERGLEIETGCCWGGARTETWLMVVDASVWVAAFLAHDSHHAEAAGFLRKMVEDGAPVMAPLLVLPEVAGAVGRQTASTVLAAKTIAFLRAQPWLQMAPLNDAIALMAASIAAQQRLRGADAVYVALAAQGDGILITLDREMLTRAPPSVRAVTPSEWLK